MGTSGLLLQFARSRKGKGLGISVASMLFLLLGRAMRPVCLSFRHFCPAYRHSSRRRRSKNVAAPVQTFRDSPDSRPFVGSSTEPWRVALILSPKLPHCPVDTSATDDHERISMRMQFIQRCRVRLDVLGLFVIDRVSEVADWASAVSSAVR